MNRTLDVATSFLASGARLGSGLSVDRSARQPEKLLELYEFEACPFCRKVREMLTRLDLDAMVHPCPPKGTRYRPQAIAKGGKSMFPYLVDPNTGEALYESDDINRYLSKTYGDGSVPMALSMGPLTALSSGVASAFRARKGGRVRPSKHPDQPLELWSMEGSPYSRIVREALCELELRYVLHNVAPGSARRAAFKERVGRATVPYLTDPNTGTAMHESADIVRYLNETYGA